MHVPFKAYISSTGCYYSGGLHSSGDLGFQCAGAEYIRETEQARCATLHTLLAGLAREVDASKRRAHEQALIAEAQRYLDFFDASALAHVARVAEEYTGRGLLRVLLTSGPDLARRLAQMDRVAALDAYRAAKYATETNQRSGGACHG